jgi:hypothetical protein
MRRLPTKRLGEAVEGCFLYCALFENLIVGRIWGDSRPFEFYVGVSGRKRVNRIQVRGTRRRRNGGFEVSTTHGRWQRPYTARDCDFIAVYVVPLKTWYIIPIRAIRRKVSIHVFPEVPNSKGKYERYRERWDLLRR